VAALFRRSRIVLSAASSGREEVIKKVVEAEAGTASHRRRARANAGCIASMQPQLHPDER
jgi:hypothetical protein